MGGSQEDVRKFAACKAFLRRRRSRYQWVVSQSRICRSGRGLEVGCQMWESCGSCGRALGEVWELWELDLLLRARCGSSGCWIRRSGRGLGALWAGGGCGKMVEGVGVGVSAGKPRLTRSTSDGSADLLSHRLSFSFITAMRETKRANDNNDNQNKKKQIKMNQGININEHLESR